MASFNILLLRRWAVDRRGMQGQSLWLYWTQTKDRVNSCLHIIIIIYLNNLRTLCLTKRLWVTVVGRHSPIDYYVLFKREKYGIWLHLKKSNDAVNSKGGERKEMWMHQRLLVSRKITIKRRIRRLNGFLKKSWNELLIYNLVIEYNSNFPQKILSFPSRLS